MKVQFLTGLVLVFSAGVARADFICEEVDGTAKLAVLHVVDGRRTKVEVVVHSPDAVFISEAAMDVSGNGFYTIHDYYLMSVAEEQQPAKLTITSHPAPTKGGCGRGGCGDPLKTVSTGKLLYDGLETKFNCYMKYAKVAN